MQPTRFTLPTNHQALVAAAVEKGGAARDSLSIEGIRVGQFQGYAAWRVETPWSTAAISMFGGQVLSFVPQGHEDVFWLSPRAARPPTPIRGGVPIVWPYFGRQDQQGDLPAHGFARTVAWTLDDVRRDADGRIEIRLSAPRFDGLPLRLRMELRVGETLEQHLVTENAGDEPVVYSEALHGYFRVGDVERAWVEGVDGLDYLDKYADYASFAQQGHWRLSDPRDPGRSDRIYGGGSNRYLLVDPVGERRLVLETEGVRALVIWNPGSTGAAAMADVGAEVWKDFLCLEPANAGEWRCELAPGATHVLTQRIRVLHGID